jgi:hypothetical protein
MRNTRDGRRRAWLVVGAVTLAVLLTLAAVVAMTRPGHRPASAAAAPTPSASTAPTSSTALTTTTTTLATTTSTTIMALPPPPTCCPAGAGPPSETVAVPTSPPRVQLPDLTGVLGVGTSDVQPAVGHVGEDLDLGLLVRNSSGQAIVIGDPTGHHVRVQLALVCSHLSGRANWSLPFTSSGSQWPAEDNTGITNAALLDASDIGRQTCEIAFVRGGRNPVFVKLANATISEGVTIVAPLPNIPAVHFTVVPAAVDSTPTSTSTTPADTTTSTRTTDDASSLRV